MRIRALLVAALLLAGVVGGACCVPRGQVPGAPSQSAARVLEAISELEPATDGTMTCSLGSAFVARVSGRPYLFSAWHVTRARLMSITGAGTGVSTRFLRYLETDVAYAPLDAVPAGWACLEVCQPPIGSQCAASGWVDGSFVVATGRVNSLETRLESTIAAPNSLFCIGYVRVVGGMSGGPVTTADGRVFALTSAGARDGTAYAMFSLLPASL
jgi:hypothetical protein